MLYLLFFFLIISIYAFIVAYQAPRRDGNMELHMFSRDISNALKGVLAIGIVFSHLEIFCFRPHHYYVSSQFTALAQVGVFFFISGYGLTYAFKKKRTEYLNGFLSKHLLRIFMPLLIATIFYLTCYNKWSLSVLMGGAMLGDTPLPHSWFCFVILLYYIWFYISAKIFHDVRLLILLMFLPTVLSYIFMGELWHWGDYWYQSNVGFNVGMVFRYFESDIRKIFARFTPPLLALFPFMLFCIYAGGHFGIGMEMQAIGFSLITILLIYIIGFPNGRVLQWIGNYSYEIYLTHGTLLPLYVFWPVVGPLGDFLFACCVFGGTFALAFLLKKITSSVIDKKYYICSHLSIM